MSIRDAIREQKLKTLRKSLSYSEAVERHTHEQAVRTKELLTGQLSTELSPDVLLRDAYFKQHASYTGKTSYAMKSEQTKKSKALWERVAAKWQQSGVSPDDYIKAQFMWFDKNFGKAPTVVQLATDAALDRAREMPKTVVHRVVGVQEVKVDFAQLMRDTEKQMQTLMRANNLTREQVYTNLVLTGIYSFPKEFLNADPIYKKLTEGR